MEPQSNLERSGSRFNVGYFFLSLGVLITLITSVVYFFNLVFATLDKRFPDVLNANYQYGYSTYAYEDIRTALATLIIFFPVFLIVSYYWRKFPKISLGAIDETIRKWVIYIILFLSSLVAVIDFVTLVRYFISGEITTRFILKVLTVLVVAGLVGFYYIYLLRGKMESRPQISLIFRIVAILLFLGAICYSFMILGSPMKQRALRLDDRRVNDLINMQYQIINHWQQKEALPKELSELANPLTGYYLPVDPEFEKGKNYEYSVLDEKNLKFELCATFAEPMPKGWVEYGGGVMPIPTMRFEKDIARSYPYPGGGMNESWDHEAGRTCFERTIDKELYPPYPDPVR
jgi:hypothetical protein